MGNLRKITWDGRVIQPRDRTKRVRKFVDAADAPLFVRQLLRIMFRKGYTSYRLHKETGTGKNAVSNWRVRGRGPNVETMQKVLEPMGFKLAIVPLDYEEIPADDVPVWNEWSGKDGNPKVRDDPDRGSPHGGPMRPQPGHAL
jgi:hypothetical protein